MPKNNQVNKGQGATKGMSNVSPGQTGRINEEYATELGGGTTGMANPAGKAGAGGGAARQRTQTKRQK